jgi:uncharacterized ParB-like nuclease family protein
MPNKTIKLDDIRIDGGTQPREAIDESLIAEYAEAIDDLPPLIVFYDGTDYWLADGFHRWHAANRLGRKTIDCDVRKGDRRAAVLFSVGANADHGKRRTNADKRKAVQTLLDDPEWAKWSDREIAKACRVSHDTVATLRPKIVTGDSASEKAPVRVYTSKSGKVAEMKVAKRSGPPPAVKPLTPYELAQQHAGPIREMQAALNDVIQQAAKLAEDKLFGPYVRFQQIKDGIENAKRAIKFATPASPCPFMPNCTHGSCKCCKGTGWIPADILERLGPTEQAMLRRAEG